MTDKAPKTPLRIGVIGCGGFARFGLEAVAPIEEISVAALVDPVEEFRSRAAQAWLKARSRAGLPAPEPALYADHRHMLGTADIAAVWVLTPPHLHFRVTRDALLAGKHAFVEKPGSLDVLEIEELVDLAERLRLRTGINFVMRHNPLYRWIKRLLDDRVLGPLERVALENCARDDQLPVEHWFWDETLSGGIWVEHGVHFFDLFNWLLGPASTIVALAAERTTPAGSVRDAVAATALHRSPHAPEQPPVLAGHYHGFTRPTPLEMTTLTLVFQQAYLRIEGWIPVRLDGTAWVDDAAAARLAAPWLSVSEERLPTGRGRFLGRGKAFTASRKLALRADLGDRQELYRECIRAGWRNLLRAIADPGFRPAADLTDALSALRVAAAATTSQQTGFAITIGT